MTSRLAIAAGFFCLALFPARQVFAERQMEDMSFVVLRTIDKLSARTHTFEIPVDKTVKFSKSLFIKARACRKASPLDKPENAAFLQIWERKPNEDDAQWVFSGWMFSSSPSLSAMDHGVYDVWVIECKNAATSEKEEFSSETVPEGAPAAASETSAEKAEDAEESAVEDSVEEETLETPASDPEPEETVPGAAGATPRLEEMPSSFEEAGD